MVYVNVKFDNKAIFKTIDIYPIDPPLTKKKKNINKKKLSSPYGTVISVQLGIYFRGVRLSKPKTYWCPKCQQIIATDDGDQIKINTVVENIGDVEEDDEYFGVPHIKIIKFWCTECESFIAEKQLGTIVPFLNQLTMSISTGDRIANVMSFGTSFKIAGIKELTGASQMVSILWEKFNICKDNQLWKSIEGDDVRFLIETVMCNMKIELGFSVDKEKLNKLFNSYAMCEEKASNIVQLSQCETTSTTSVNIKMSSSKPEEFKYEMLVYSRNGFDTSPTILSVLSKPSFAKRSKKNKNKYVTFIVFVSGQIILTGRYISNMRKCFDFFRDSILTNIDNIKEIKTTPTISYEEFMQ